MNPFDDEQARFSVAVNGKGEHALWPEFADVPSGWTVAHGPDGRAECLAYVRGQWTDLRPPAPRPIG